jgi:hypothetical protein
MDGEPSPTTSKRRVDAGRVPRRSVWRQELVETERGLVLGFRRDSAIVGHLFLGSLVIVGGLLFDFRPYDWALVVICLTFLLACEMFRQAVGLLCDRTPFPEVNPDQPPPAGVTPLQEIAGMLRGAMTLATVGACGTLGIVFWQRLAQMFAR